MEDYDECEPKDGLYEENSNECQSCERRCREMCKIMAMHKGYYSSIDLDRYPKEIVDLIMNDSDLKAKVK